ncbi:Calx-beta domain-containing protein [Kordia sp.]|uniref:Calx-beta domain-containing protein n=1 Tax=Kordia sp. TaxID=1965332 RepID=UPI003D2BAEAA
MKNITSKILVTLLVSLLFFFSASAQNISGVVNSYTTVTAVSGTTVTVGSSAGLAVNDPVMIIQMTGISGGGNTGGTDNGAGNFHLAKITNIAGNTLTIDTSVTKTFTPATERVQLVRIAKYTSDVTVVGTVSAQPWNGNTGGIIFIDACDNNITMNASINASGDGFFGRNTTGNFVVDNCGESAALVNTPDENWGTDPIYFGGDFGNAAPLSGGTGRGGHGGCDGAQGAPDGGAGVGGNGANSTDATLGSGGGGGGYGGGGTSGGAGTTISGTAAPAVGSVFDTASNLRLFMGASGGSEVEWAPATGNGGGIIIVLANNITTNGSNRNIVSDGIDGPNSGTYSFFGDPSNVTGGAGGAGYVAIQANSINSQVRVFARGGDATTQPGGSPVFIEYGGPGGGGFVISSSAITTTSVRSGNILVGNGARAGAAGRVVTDAGVSTTFTLECLNCNIADAGKTNETCNNNLTRDRSDDYVSFDLNPTGTDLGTTYTVSVDNGGVISPTSGTYGAAQNFRLQDGSANNTLYTITITDDVTGTCSITTTIQQSNCDIDFCDLSITGNIDSDSDGVADFCDEDDDNDGILDTQEQCATDPVPLNLDSVVRIEIDLDQFSTEVGWSFSQGATVLFNQPTGSYTTGNITVSQDITVTENDTYLFTITDTFGDGIQGNSYRVLIDGVIAINQTFGSPSDTTTFSATENVSVTTIVSNPFSCLPGDPMGDEDGDGIINYQDADFCALNANGVCSNLDSDNDGIINSLDDDSDNDGCVDALEAGHTDDDMDGVLGNSPVTVNSSNGRVTGQGGYTGTDLAVTNSGNTTACDSCEILSASVTAIFCDNNGTPTNDADDTFTFYINPNGNLLGSTYSLSGDITQANISYDLPEQFGPFSIAGGNITFTITDDSDGSCQLTNVVVAPPATCSSSTSVDTDNDTVEDAIDIDNDNDGIIDDNENVCVSRPLTTGAWAGSLPYTNSAGSVGISYNSSIPAGGLIAYTPDGTMTTNSFFSDAAVEGSNSLEFLFAWDTSSESLDAASDDRVTGTITITYDQPVYNPIIHIDRLGGNNQIQSGNFISNTSLWTLQNANLTMGKISGNNQLIVTSKQFYRDVNQNLGTSSPIVLSGEADNGGFGTAAGSIQIYGRVTTLTFQVTGEGIDGTGSDVLEMTFDACPVVDTDGDTIPDFLDTDSDGDGCPDALEGGDNILASAVDGSGMLTGTVEPTTGVPNNVNTTLGQTAGTSTDNTQFDAFGQCDEDGDGVIDANDICNGFDDNANADGDSVPDGCDLDDDNDGILDTTECVPTTVFSNSGGGFSTDNTAPTISQSITNVNPYGIGNTLSIGTLSVRDSNPSGPSDYVLVTISYGGLVYATFESQEGVKSSEQIINYSNGASGSLRILPYSELGTISDSWDIYLPATIPDSGTIEVVIDMTNKEGSSTEGVDDVVISNLSIDTCQDTDADLTPDYLDTDSDNDGCADAIEGAANFTATDLTSSNNLADDDEGAVGTNGVPTNTGSPQATNANVTTATQAAITADPATSQTILEGGSVTFTAAASSQSTTTFASGAPNYTVPPATDSSANIVYQWQESTDNGATWSDITVAGTNPTYSGFNTNTLTLTNVPSSYNGYDYQLIITHSENSCILLDSQDANLVVNPLVAMSVGDVTVAEDNGSASVPVSIDNPSSVDTVVAITTVDNSAEDPNDYTTTTVTATIPAGQTTVNVSIPITDDTVGEPTEDFTVNGSVTSGNTSNTTDSGTVTITDNDTPAFTVGDVTVAEDNGSASVPVSIDNPSSVDTVVAITTVDNSAEDPNDYTSTTVTATIPAGQTTVNVSIPITDDTIGEPTEDFTVNGSVTSGNTSNTTDSGTVTITDNDTPAFTVGDVTVAEDNGSASVPVSIDNPSSVDTVVAITTVDNSAEDPNDYTTTTVTATIPAGQTTVNVSIPITDDTVGEPTEDFTVNGSVTSGNTSNTTDSGTVTITDNDTPAFTVGDVTVAEDNGSASVPVSIDNPSSVDTVVAITTVDNSAEDPNDYTTTTVTATIPAGQTTVNVSIPITDDTVGEPTEDFTVNGSVTSGNTSNTTDSQER